MALLLTPNYTSKVRQALTELIEKNQNNQTEAKGKPYIVTDWDNTAIIFDSQQSLFIYQIENLHYRLTPERFAQIIEMDLTADQKAEVKELLYDINKCYHQIYTDYQAMGGDYQLNEIKQTAEYEIFYLAMACLYKYPFGHFTECCRILYLFENYSLEEVAQMTEASIIWSEMMPPQKKVFEYDRNGKSWRAVFYLGMRPVPEQREFYQKCMESGIAVYVCSASHQTVVEVHAARYGIPAENVLAVEVQTDENRRIKAEMKAGRPFTILEGKAQAIRHSLLPKHGREPLLVMGDSMGDFAMLTDFQCLRMLVHTKNLNRVLQAMKEIGIDQNSILIQGRNDQLGEFQANEQWDSFS